MKTKLPIGSYIRYRDSQQEDGFMFAEIVKGTPKEKYIRPMSGKYVPNGVTVQPGVFKKGDVFEPRGKTFVMTTGGQTPPKMKDLFKKMGPTIPEMMPDIEAAMGSMLEAMGLPSQKTCPHTKTTHVVPIAGPGGTVCLECGKGWPDADGPLKGKTPQ